MPRCLVAILLLALTLSSCTRQRIEQDAAIDAELVTKMDALNQRLIKGIQEDRAESLFALCSDELQGDAGIKAGMQQLVESGSAIAQRHSFQTMHRFYVRNPEKGLPVILNSGGSGEHDYEIKYMAPTRHTYVSVGYFEDSIRSIALLSIWGSFNGEWRLTSAWVGLLKVYGKDAVDWYYGARQQYGSNAIADAANSMVITESLLHPGGTMWRYRREEDMTGLKEQIRNTAARDFSFPIRMKSVATAPQVFGVSLKVLQEGFFPIINYATNLSMQDTAALSRECDSVNAHIGEVFNDVDHNNRTLLYRAYIRVPIDSTEQLPSHAFIRHSASWHY